MRRGDLTLERAQTIQSEAEDLMRGAEYALDSRAVLQFVNDSTCSAYDCEFVALAQKLEIPLITMDRKLLREFPGIAMPLYA